MQQQRRFDIDALRVFAFGLLILYHVGMFYVPDWGWHVKSQYSFEWLKLPMSFSSQWRMSLLFMISGIAMRFVVGRYSPGRLAVRRIWRLQLPLIFGMAVIVAPQCYFEALNKGIIEPGFFRFWVDYLTFQDFPGEAWAGEEIIGWTWNHLWYLPYVLFYTLVLLGIVALAPGALERVAGAVVRLRGAWLLAVPAAFLTLVGLLVRPHFPDMTHAFGDDWYAHAIYGSLFLMGYLMGQNAALWRELVRLRYVTLLAGVAAFAALQYLDGSFVYHANRWVWLLTIFGWANHLLNRPYRWLPYATQAVYPWYILHQTLTVAIGYTAAQWSLGPILEPAIVLAGTIIGCALLHEFVIRRTALIRPLFGLAARARRSSPSDKRSGVSHAREMTTVWKRRAT